MRPHFALGYDRHFLPSFVTPAAVVDQLRMAHASCRKMHGPGSDAMAYLDGAIKGAINNPAERIQQLYLTGDQIYADDVPSTGLPMIHDLAMALIRKRMPCGGGGGGGNGLERADATHQHGNRAAARRGASSAPMTASPHNAANHLITFGEYAALYLLAWSPRVWQAPASDISVFMFCDFEHPDAPPSALNRTRLGPLLVGEDEPAPTGMELRLKVDEAFAPDLKIERQNNLFARTGQGRRVMANTATT